MERNSCRAYTTTLLLALLLILPAVSPARQIEGWHSRRTRHRRSKGHTVGTAMFIKPNIYRAGEESKRRKETVQFAGSSLPDCSHACGSCSPCRLVMVSFVCIEEAETCPMAYKCMCHSKSYPVP